MSRQKSFGEVLRTERMTLGLTQGQLARRAGVQSSHVAYLENGQRRPSLALLRRLTRILGLKGGRLLFLVYPELAELLDPDGFHSRAKERHRAWKDFAANKALLASYEVSSQELKVLSTVNLLGKVSGPRQFLFILTAIRCALEEEQLLPCAAPREALKLQVPASKDSEKQTGAGKTCPARRGAPVRPAESSCASARNHVSAGYQGTSASRKPEFASSEQGIVEAF
jgi:transcriptional regulator with XRE-family HTH domain